MIRLIYSSAVNPTFHQGELQRLLSHYRQRNQQLGICSLLLFMNGDFLQVLEGEEEAVQRIYQLIQQDRHHLQLTLLSRENIDAPAFAGHSLLFIDTEELTRKLGHPVHLSNIAQHGELDRSEAARRFVQEFINGKWHHHLANGTNPQVVRRH